MTTQDDELISCNNNHNHPTEDQTEVEAEKVISSLRKKLSKTIQPVPLLYQAEIQDLSRRQDKAAKLPTLQSMKSSLYRECRKRLPPMPHTREKVR